MAIREDLLKNMLLNNNLFTGTCIYFFGCSSVDNKHNYA